MGKNLTPPPETYYTYLTNPSLTGWHAALINWGADAYGNFLELSLTVAKPESESQASGTGRITIGPNVLIYNKVVCFGGCARHYVTGELGELKKDYIVNIERD